MAGVVYHTILEISDENDFYGEVGHLVQPMLWFLSTKSNKKPI